MNYFLPKGLLWFLLALFPSGVAALDLPRRLTSNDRKEVTQILGLGATPKILSNPYPLGGYSGFEVGFSVDFINVDGIDRLGCQPTDPGCPNLTVNDQEQLRIPRVSFGKGLYENLDVFLNFTPPVTQGIVDFGGHLRWSFFEAKFLPINLSVLTHVSRANFLDQFISQTSGVKLIAGVNINHFALYFGIGYLESTGSFIGGDLGTGTVAEDDPQLEQGRNTVKETVYSTHTLVGFTYHWRQYFIASQIDRHFEPVYSLKLGLRL